MRLKCSLLKTVAFGALIFTTGLSTPATAQQEQATEKAPAALSYDARLSAYPYPYDVAYYKFQSQGQDLEMAYMYLPATDDEKGVIVLFHGKNFNGAYWQSTAEYLQSLGYGVLMPDQIGFGKSSKPTSYQYSFSALARNTKSLLTHLDIENPIIVGHSMGGMLASRFALNYPDMTQLILVNPIGLENYLKYVAYKDVNFFYEMERGKSAEKIIKYQKKNYYDGTWNEDYEALTRPLVGWVNGPDWEQLAQVSARTYDIIFTQPVITEYPSLSMPTTLILGTRDRTGPGRGWKKEGVSYELGRYDTLGPRVKALNPDMITVHELEGLGHLPHIEDFQQFKGYLTRALQDQ